MTWVELSDFQSFVGNTNPADAPALQMAIDLGCEKVDELCGPTITTSMGSEHVHGPGYRLVLNARATSLTSVATWVSGLTLNVSDYVAEGQVLSRKDGGWISDDLLVAYVAGAATAPPWAKTAACLIGKQWFNSRLRPNLNDPTTLVGFLVPKQAMEIMADHLLAPGGVA